MAPPIAHSCLDLQLLPGSYFVSKLEPGQFRETMEALLEVGAGDSPFLSVTRTHEELSVVGIYSAGMPIIKSEDATWRAIKIAGPMPFELTGVLAGFVEPLKRASVPVFALSTWNTDYVLIPKNDTDTAINALETDGWVFALK